MDQAGTIGSALKLARGTLEPISESASSDAQVLLASFLERPKAWVLAHPEFQLTKDIQNRILDALERLGAGDPLPYVLGRWAFYGRGFKVTPSVLIPRPETEVLIEMGLAFLKGLDQPGMVVDVGTGTGCLAVTLAAESSGLGVLATDRSGAALKVARENAELHGVSDRIHWVQADLLGAISVRFDLVLANLPYIPSSRLMQLSVGDHEPRAALDGGEHGLDFITRLIAQLPQRLSKRGMALLEIDESQGERVTALSMEILPAAEVRLKQDLAGLDRYVTISRRE